ncbi:hypothetical protein [Prevotella nigrescens]|uniref:hypothetical protein n=1 Tax=Prevotella nigrescens TaxID=28133 RepID=UPI0005664547|nr:hypothetical protein [Prevotella nigrescens]QUB54048.1 hypothetical protein J4865_01255 [Prevotella nigrescens F0103]
MSDFIIIPNWPLDRNTIKTATELLQSSQRGYDDCRNRVTANTVTSLRQTSLRNIGKHGCLLMPWHEPPLSEER